MKQVQNNIKRYPSSRHEYCKVIGRLRESNIKCICYELDFKVDDHKLEANNADNVARNVNEEVLFVMEEVNEYLCSFIDTKRAKSMIKNFSEFPNVPHIVVTSFGRMTKEAKRLFEENNVYLVTIGFQTLPADYFKWYKKKGITKGRKRNSLQIYEIIKNKILHLLKKIGLIQHIYCKNNIKKNNYDNNIKSDTSNSISSKDKKRKVCCGISKINGKHTKNNGNDSQHPDSIEKRSSCPSCWVASPCTWRGLSGKEKREWLQYEIKTRKDDPESLKEFLEDPVIWATIKWLYKIGFVRLRWRKLNRATERIIAKFLGIPLSSIRSAIVEDSHSLNEWLHK